MQSVQINRYKFDWFTAIEKNSKQPTTNKKDDEKELVLPSSSPPDNEFISDAFNEDHINEEDLRAEMKQFGLTEEKKNTAKTDGMNML